MPKQKPRWLDHRGQRAQPRNLVLYSLAPFHEGWNYDQEGRPDSVRLAHVTVAGQCWTFTSFAIMLCHPGQEQPDLYSINIEYIR
jgi:hypothetical protein